ncbi:GNAT family N-acetyltransferase [Zongyangia hominis]|uniref:GNAT family N-acetyltransferase n=1 Tax=Zongyangia hominis TaxID=2763677 RepID=A0A926EEA3_9FIRM|nr:GNAT family N-acetyltransferase [Zongyangia hominis]MBC8570311.1 GNAT family N-acetyltransferase [Zongyangia hominis]
MPCPSQKLHEESPLSIVPYEDRYADALSSLIRRNFRQVNSRDYPCEEIERLCARHTPEDVRILMGEGSSLVALRDTVPVGCARLLPDREDAGTYGLYTVFVDPDFHGKGVGRLLLQRLEEKARALGGKKVVLASSLTARGFYERLGYRAVHPGEGPDSSGLIPMEKVL